MTKKSTKRIATQILIFGITIFCAYVQNGFCAGRHNPIRKKNTPGTNVWLNANNESSYYRAGGTVPYPKKKWKIAPHPINRRVHRPDPNRIRNGTSDVHWGSNGWTRRTLFIAKASGFKEPVFRWYKNGKRDRSGDGPTYQLVNYFEYEKTFPEIVGVEVRVHEKRHKDKQASYVYRLSIQSEYVITNDIRKVNRWKRRQSLTGDISSPFAPNTIENISTVEDNLPLSILVTTLNIVAIGAEIGGKPQLAKAIAGAGAAVELGQGIHDFHFKAEAKPYSITSMEDAWTAAVAHQNHVGGIDYGKSEDGEQYIKPRSWANIPHPYLAPGNNSAKVWDICYFHVYAVEHYTLQEWHVDTYSENGYVSSGNVLAKKTPYDLAPEGFFKKKGTVAVGP